MSFFRNLFKTAEQVVSAADKFNAASALSAYAISTFDRVVDDLETANGDLVAVVDEVDEELRRLTTLRTAALRQAGQNGNAILNIRRLVGTVTE